MAQEQPNCAEGSHFCGECGKQQADPNRIISGRCPDCFVCKECEQLLVARKFVEHEGDVYCVRDYRKLFSPKCQGCNKSIHGKYVNALDGAWHPEHFVCTECSNQLGAQFASVNGKPYCTDCATKLVAKACEACSELITDGGLIAEGKHYHSACLKCLEGHDLSQEMPFVSAPDGFICQEHWEKLYVKSCHTCKERITGVYLCVLEKFFHKSCLKCSKCSESLASGKIGLDTDDNFLCGSCIETQKTEFNAPLSGNNTNESEESSGHQQNGELDGTPDSAVSLSNHTAPTGASRIIYETSFSEDYIIEGVVGKRIDYLPFETNTFSLSELQDRLPEGVDPMNREKYLSPNEFKEVFGMSLVEFEALPKWKQKRNKSEKRLF